MNLSPSTSQVPSLDKEHGFYNSALLALAPDTVYSFCQDEKNVEKVLSDLPMGLEKFLDLVLLSADQTGPDQYEIKWQNRPETKTKATLTFLIKKHMRGALVSSEAVFENFKVHDDDPSDLMTIFLKRMKALIETGEIPTVKGQPSGREELPQNQPNTLH